MTVGSSNLLKFRFFGPGLDGRICLCEIKSGTVDSHSRRFVYLVMGVPISMNTSNRSSNTS